MYLLFKDQNLEVRHELLVTPEDHPPSLEEAEFINRTRNARPNGPNVHAIVVTEHQQKCSRRKRKSHSRSQELSRTTIKKAPLISRQWKDHLAPCNQCRSHSRPSCPRPIYETRRHCQKVITKKELTEETLSDMKTRSLLE